MDFNQIVNQARETHNGQKTLKYPTKIYKELAITHTLNSWLKFYTTNKPIALWILRWTKFEIGRIPFHISLNEYSPNEASFKHLQNFFDDYTHIQGLTVPSKLLVPKMISEIERFGFLNELIINCDPNMEIPQVQLPYLETLIIINKNTYNIHHFNRIKQFPLKNLYIHSNILPIESILIIQELKLETLTLINTELTDDEIIPQELFHKKARIRITNCNQRIVNFINHFLDNSTEAITIENSRPEVEIKFEDIIKLTNLNCLKINLKINCVTQYFNFLRIIRAVPQNQSCRWYVTLTFSPSLVVEGPVDTRYEMLKTHVANVVRDTTTKNKNTSFTIHLE